MFFSSSTIEKENTLLFFSFFKHSLWGTSFLCELTKPSYNILIKAFIKIKISCRSLKLNVIPIH